MRPGRWRGHDFGFFAQVRAKDVAPQRRHLGLGCGESLFRNFIRKGRELSPFRLLRFARRLLLPIAACHLAEGLCLLALLLRQGFGVLLTSGLLLFLSRRYLGLVPGGQNLIALQILFRIHMGSDFVLRVLTGALLPRGFRHALRPGDSCREG
jgi:hypothetical protein